MNLEKDFSIETRELFVWNQECWECRQNHWDCLHHIMNRTSNSPLNAAPLNNFDCHIGNGKISQFETKKKYLKKTLKYLLDSGYILTKKDLEFKNKHIQYYED